MRFFHSYFVSKRSNDEGFTLVEIMVAVIILSVGLLGMAAMTILATRSNTLAERGAALTGLLHSNMERLKGVDYSLLGTGDCSAGLGFGLSNGICQETGLNAQGETSGTGTGPYIYNIFLKICDSTSVDETGSINNAKDRCDTATIDSTVPELACEGATPTDVMVMRLMASQRTHGDCHFQSMTLSKINSR